MTELRRCEKCGETLPENAKFCVKCGTPARTSAGAVCPRCSAPVASGSSFCVRCGQMLDGGAPEENKRVDAYTEYVAKPEELALSQPEQKVPAPQEMNISSEAVPWEKANADNICPHCNSPLRTGLAFCTHCGTRLGSLQSKTKADAHSVPPEHNHVPIQVSSEVKNRFTLVLGFLRTTKGKYIAAAGVACIVLIAVLGFTLSGSSAEAHYKKACDAMSEIAQLNWNPEQPEDDTVYEKLWSKVEKELRIAADKGSASMKCDYVEFIFEYVPGKADDYVIDKKVLEAYLRKAASEGSSRAKFYLGAFNILSSADERQSFMTEACEDGNPYALHFSAMGYFNATGDIAGALNTLIQAAQSLEISDPDNTPFMGELFNLNYKIAPLEAAKWPAEIGAVYELGLAGKINLPEALIWYEKSQSVTNRLRNPGNFFCLASAASGDDPYQFDNVETAVNRVKAKMR